MEGSNASTKKLLKRQKKIEGEDLINKLPEPLISRILSSLPTKDAVRTSVLSKKWIFRWTFITNLDLDDTVFYSKRKTGGKQYFMNFVYRALLLTKTSTLESFSLVVANKYDVSLLNTWICNVLIRSVKNLRIDTHFEMSFSALASHSLFNSRFLEELVLKMNSCAIRVTETFEYFGRLKLLKLSGILFTLDFGSEHLTLSLPVLKVFETKNCAWLNAMRVTLKVPLLESVTIQDAKSMSKSSSNCAIEFSASHLRKFTYCGCGYISHCFELLDPSSARNASLYVAVNQCPINRDPETELRAFLLLKHFSQVKYLKFKGCEVLEQSRVANLPLFGMLSQLELGLVSGEVLLGLLLKSPVLKTLAFKGISEFDIGLLNCATVPDCLRSTLQVVKFQKVNGGEHELCLAKFFMENSSVMKRMSFSLVSHWLGTSKIMEVFKEKLYSFKKGFSFAIIEFSYG